MKHVLAIALALSGALGSAPALADDSSNLLSEVKPMLALTSYRERIVITHNGKTTTRLLDFVAPDRIHMSGTGAPEMLSIGSKSWMRAPGGSWNPMPMGLGSMVASMRSTTAISAMLKDVHSTYADGGTGLWKGQPAHLFRSTSDFGGIHARTTYYVLSDHYIHHADSVTSLGTTSIDFSDFNSRSVSIQPPA